MTQDPPTPETSHFHAYLEFGVGRYARAADDLKAALSRDPGNSNMLFDLGVVYARMNDPDKAMETFDQAGTPAALSNAAVLAAQAGEPSRARASLRKALAARPSLAQRLHLTLRLLGLAQGRFDETLAWDVAGLDTPAVQDLIASVYLNIGAAQQAVAASERAIAAEPTAMRYVTLSNAWRTLGQFEPAAAALEKALVYEPGLPEAVVDLGYMQELLRRYDAAALHYQAALARDPGDWFVLARLLAVYAQQGELRLADDTLRRLRQALTDFPERAYHWEKLCTVAYRATIWPLPASTVRNIAASIDRQLSDFAHRQERGDITAPAGTGRIRVGYLSSFFTDHPVGHNTLALFAAHDRNRFEVHVFSYTSGATSYTDTIAAGAENFHALRGGAAAVAAEIRAAGIEILVTFDGYMEHTLLAAVALKPAPVQVFFPGHAGEAVLSAFDYMIADRIVIPREDAFHIRAKVVTLQDGFHIASPQPMAATPRRAAAGLPDQGFVFCAFNNPEKIDLAIFEAWMRILAAVDGSVLWLSVGRSPAFADHLRREAERCGVSPERLIFATRVSDKAEHLARHGCADLFLDTLTLNAATTAVDCLWAGLPVLALQGARFSSRVTTTILTAIGLADMVCTSLADYERRAIFFAAHPDALAEVRVRLKANRDTTPLFDVARFCRNLEKAFTVMSARHRAGQKPAGFHVE